MTQTPLATSLSPAAVRDLRTLANNEELLWNVARFAIESELIEWRDSRRSIVGRNNGFVVKEYDGTPSDVIRFGPEAGVRIALLALADHLEAHPDLIGGALPGVSHSPGAGSPVTSAPLPPSSTVLGGPVENNSGESAPDEPLCGHQFDAGGGWAQGPAVSMACTRKPHPENPNGHIYESTSVPQINDTEAVQS